MTKVVVFFVIAAFSLIVISIWAAVEEMHYKKDHQCVNIGEPKVTFMPLIISRSIYFMPTTTFMYQCDNGKKRFS